MRTTQRDGQGVVTFSGRLSDAASGSGIAQPGVPFTFTRTGTGIYQVNFDNAIIPLALVANPVNVSISRFSTWGAGLANAILESPPGTFANGSFHFTITARDGRR